MMVVVLLLACEECMAWQFCVMNHARAKEPNLTACVCVPLRLGRHTYQVPAPASWYGPVRGFGAPGV